MKKWIFNQAAFQWEPSLFLLSNDFKESTTKAQFNDRKGIIYEVTASELTNLSGLYSVKRKKKEKKQAILD